jgi:hypothetical protein
MADFERSATLGVAADAAFDLFAEPDRLPEYLPMVAHVESEVVDGDAAEATTGPVGGAGGGHEVRFLADRVERRVEWGIGDQYAGSIFVVAGTANTCGVTIRLRTRDDVDAAKVEEILDGALRNIRRVLSRR